MRRGDRRLGIAQHDRVRIEKACRGADELEFATGQLLAAIIRKLFDERVLARHHLRKVEPHIFRPDTPRRGMAGAVQDFSGIQQRLRRHATAQDAQPAHFRPAFDHDCSQTGARHRPRRRVTGAATAENGDIVVEYFFHCGQSKSHLGADWPVLAGRRSMISIRGLVCR